MRYENLELLLRYFFEDKGFYDLFGKDKSKLNYNDVKELEGRIEDYFFNYEDSDFISREDFDTLSNEYDELQNEYDQVNQENEELSDEIEELEHEIRRLKEDNDKLQ